ncbi:MAG: rhodanese-like domain-containing protein [Bacteroidia bacterium]|nr:rhodanese-like domain-containing protein [Bacteroidia bacterium]
MKELEKTKRISIAAVLTILIILIGLLSYKRPKHIYALNTKSTLENMTGADYLITLEQINNPDILLVDIRNQYDYDKGHLENAVNIYAPEILNDVNSEIFKELKENNKTIVLYGNNPHQVIAPYMLLFQLGYNNIKILTIDISYDQNKMITQHAKLENTEADINAFIEESVKKAAVKPKPVIKSIPKKVIPIKKKKKMPVEGGC